MKHRKFTEDEKLEIVSLRCSSCPIRVIARLLGKNESTIRSFLKRQERKRNPQQNASNILSKWDMKMLISSTKKNLEMI